MCSGVREHISAKGEEKSYFKGGKKGRQITLESYAFYVPQYGSVKKILNMHLHCTGVSCEEGADSYFCFPNVLLVIS